MRRLSLLIGIVVLACVWLGPLPALAVHAFAAHMTMHMAVVAVAAAFLALGLASGPFDPARRWPSLFSPVAASFGELIVVWSWHAPGLHTFARESGVGFVLEQGSFLLVGLWLWLSAFGGAREGSVGLAGRSGMGARRQSTTEPSAWSQTAGRLSNAGTADESPAGRRAAGVAGLLFTSMHMTLLGALLALTPRALYPHMTGGAAMTALEDQHLGGAIMLLVGGIAYLAGGLYLTASLVRSGSPHVEGGSRSPIAHAELSGSSDREDSGRRQADESSDEASLKKATGKEVKGGLLSAPGTVARSEAPS